MARFAPAEFKYEASLRSASYHRVACLMWIKNICIKFQKPVKALCCRLLFYTCLILLCEHPSNLSHALLQLHSQLISNRIKTQRQTLYYFRHKIYSRIFGPTKVDFFFSLYDRISTRIFLRISQIRLYIILSGFILEPHSSLKAIPYIITNPYAILSQVLNLSKHLILIATFFPQHEPGV